MKNRKFEIIIFWRAAFAAGLVAVVSPGTSSAGIGNVSTGLPSEISFPIGINATCSSGYTEGGIFWLDRDVDVECPPSFIDNGGRHLHGNGNFRMAKDNDNFVWGISDDNAQVYHSSDIGLRVEQASSRRVDWSDFSAQNGTIFKNPLGLPHKNPFDPELFVPNDSSGCGGHATDTWFNGLSYYRPLSGQSLLNTSNYFNTNKYACSPEWIRLTKDPDIAYDSTADVFYTAWLERYADNPNDSTLSSGNVPNGAGSDRWDEWHLFVGKFDPDQTGQSTSDAPRGVSYYKGGGVGGSLNAYGTSYSSPIQHVRSPRITVVNGKPWVAWVEEFSSTYRDVHVAEWTGSAWDEKGGTYGVGESKACNTRNYVGDATAAKAWPSGTASHGSYQVSDLTGAIDLATVKHNGVEKAVLVTSTDVSGNCQITARIYDPSTDNMIPLGSGGNGKVAQNITGNSGVKYYNPRVAAGDGEVYVTFVNTTPAAEANVINPGKVFVYKINLTSSGVNSNWYQIKKKASSSSTPVNHWDSNSKHPSIDVQTDYYYDYLTYQSKVGGHRASLFTDSSTGYRRDFYVNKDSAQVNAYMYHYGQQVTVDSNGVSLESANKNMVTDVVITSDDYYYTASKTHQWEAANAMVQWGNSHRPKDSYPVVRVNGTSQQTSW